MRKPRRKPQHLATKLLAIRSKLGVSQIRLTQLLESDQVYTRISEYETGRREPTLMLLLKYARLANVPVESLIDDQMELPL